MAGQQQTSTRDPEYTKIPIEFAVKDFTHETHKTTKAAAKTHKASRSPTALRDRMPPHFRTHQTARKQTEREQRKSKKAQARFVTVPESCAVFEGEEAELEVKQRATLRKQPRRRPTIHLASTRKSQVVSLNVHSHDLVTLAGALALSMEGTIVEPVKVIKDHLAENPGQANGARFHEPFGGPRKGTAIVTSSSEPSVEPSTPALPQSPASTNGAFPTRRILGGGT